jgi:hypothetical protein
MTAAAAAQRLAAIIAELRRGMSLMRQEIEAASRLAIAVIPFTPQSYHISWHVAAVRLRFFSGVLRNSQGPIPLALPFCCDLRLSA